MEITSRQIKGIGRGHEIGFPTINLKVPDTISLEQGIYAAWITIEGKRYKGALHYGAIPTFDLKEKTMEVHLLNVTDATVPSTEDMEIKIEIVKRIREVRKFNTASDLALQIAEDVKNVNIVFK